MKRKVINSNENHKVSLHTCCSNLKLGFPGTLGLHWVHAAWLWHQSWMATTSGLLPSKIDSDWHRPK